ncbi:MAG TPA: hypothetical protein ENI23_15760, partial [bacterium]|nr:hypothetical protein [bacterium]
MARPKGWKNKNKTGNSVRHESKRHGLASKGIKTKRQTMKAGMLQTKKTETKFSLPQPPVGSKFEIEDVQQTFFPHPYMITPRHLLPDRMFLDKSSIQEAESQGA